MSKVLGFDVYGTLVNTSAMEIPLRELMGDLAGVFAARWREKQLEYSFRRGLMQHYADFSVCTRQALDYCCDAMAQPLSRQQRRALIAAYAELPIFADALDALAQLAGEGHRLFAFSNGAKADVQAILAKAEISDWFEGVVSAEEVRVFKPSPAVYAHFLRSTGGLVGHSWLVSSNPFDVIGARSAGMQAAWVKRDANVVYDPWDIAPSVCVKSLAELPAQLAERDVSE